MSVVDCNGMFVYHQLPRRIPTALAQLPARRPAALAAVPRQVATNPPVYGVSYYGGPHYRADVPCWFEPGPGNGVTACCRTSDGRTVCSELRWG